MLIDRVDVGKILELAARRFIAVRTGGVGADAFRPGRGVPAGQIQRAVQRMQADAAAAAVELDPLEIDQPKARQEPLHGPGALLHPLAAGRAGRGRKLGAVRLEQCLASLRAALQHLLADRRLECVQIGNPVPSELRPQPRKRTAELRFHRRKQRLHLRLFARLDLAAAHLAAVAPVLRDDAVVLADQRRMLRRLRRRQAPQKRRRFRMAELRFLILACHAALCCSRPDARRPPCADHWKPHPVRSMMDVDRSVRNPRNTRRGRRPKAPNQNQIQKNGMHPWANHIWNFRHLQLQPAVRRSIVIFHCPSSGFEQIASFKRNSKFKDLPSLSSSCQARRVV